MATKYAKLSGNWFAANAWNSQADGLGTDHTAPLPAGDTADLNGKAMTTLSGESITQAVILAATGTLTPAGTLVINGKVSYSGLSTSGMLIVGGGATVTINGQVANAGAGYCVVQTGNVTVNNPGETAVLNTGAGRGINATGAGFVQITGDVQNDGTGLAVVIASSNANHALIGNVRASAGGYAYSATTGTVTWTPADGVSATITAAAASAVIVQGCTLNVVGNLNTSETTTNASRMVAILVYSGVMNLLGNRSLAAGEECAITLQGGTLNLATASSRLVLSNSGTFVVRRIGGTLNTADAGAGAASIVNQSATAHAAILGGTAEQRAIITGPTLPAAASVAAGTGTFGYAGSPQTPSYPTTATSKAEQYAADQAAVSSASDEIDGDATILGVGGTGVTTAEIQAMLAELATHAQSEAILAAIATRASQAAADAIKARTDLLGSGSVSVRSTANVTGRVVRLVRGDDYLTAAGTAVRFTFAAGAVPDLTSVSSVRFSARSQEDDSLLISVAAVVVQSGAGTQIVDVELSHSDTQDLPAGDGVGWFDLEADFGDGGYRSLVTKGVLNVDRDETRH